MATAANHKARVEAVIKWSKENKVTRHPQGCIVLSPPGSGKSYFVSQHPADWADEDEILGETGLQIHTEEWHKPTHTNEDEIAHYTECDNYLRAMREAGLWVVGSLFEAYVPDYAVVLPESQHEGYVARRKDLKLPEVQEVTQFLYDLCTAATPNVPVLRSWESLQKAVSGQPQGVVDLADRNTPAGHAE